MSAMRVLAVVVMLAACGGANKSASTAGPVAPAPPIPHEPPATDAGPAPATADPAKPDQVAIAEDPDAGGEIAEDPDAGGEVAGQSGLGVRGTGMGGGGIGTGTIGVGTGSGIGQGYGAGAGRPGPKTGDAQIRFGTVTVKGKLDTDIVRRVIRRFASQIRYCYAQVLAQDPNASGLLTIRFVIGRDGAVTKADATGVHPQIGACVSNRAMTWAFPKPASGVVVVSQPVNMSPR